MTEPSAAAALDRRKLLEGAARAACATGFFALALAGLAEPARGLAAEALRPPGALAEDRFLAACVRCGLCVRSCPYDTLKLSALGRGPVAGTPYFEARAIPCEMCPDIPCVAACPTGALDKKLTEIENARMGVAVLVGHETCLNYLGLRCDVCYRVCPLIDEAISLDRQHNERTGQHARFIPVVHSERCTGCGKCEKSCVLDEAAIKVLPARLALGALGRHYRLGWEEKRKKGESLIPGAVELPSRRPLETKP
jgi:ferredoxin-type protein NapG